MTIRPVLGITAAVAFLTGCPWWDATPYVTLAGFVIPPRPAAVSLDDARLDLVSLKGDLGKAEVAKLAPAGTGSVAWSYSVQLDATILPQSPTLFKLVVQNPEKEPRNVALLSSLVVLNRPDGKGPELAKVRTDIDATSSIAALGIEYRVNLDPEGNYQGVNPEKAGLHLGRSNLLTFSFIQAYGSFVTGKNNDAPAANRDIAQQASEELPADLEKL